MGLQGLEALDFNRPKPQTLNPKPLNPELEPEGS